MTADTTTLDYWLNWRFLLCAIWVFSSMILASFLIWRYEGSNTSKTDDAQNQQETTWSLYEDDAWRPCLEAIHPAWLLAFRITAFFLLLALLIADVIVDGIGVFFYYTQWTFALVTIYFGLGSLLSIYGCRQYCNNGGDYHALDAEQGTYVAPTYEENSNTCNKVKSKYMQHNQKYYGHPTAGTWGYVFQVLFEMNAGAVMLTDCTFWFIIYPFLTANDYSLTVVKIVLHSVNAVFLLGDTFLNGLRFSWFRIAYFILWTGTFVIFQWVVHVCVSIGWPYPILDLSSPYAPLWYLIVAMMHLPCYGFFYLLIKIKGYLLSRCFPHSHQFLR